MIKHPRVLSLFVVAVLSVCSVGTAQDKPTLADAIRTAVNATPNRNEIKQFVDAQFARLVTDETSLSAQQGLVEVVEGTGPRAPSASFLAEYTAVLNDAVVALPDDAPMRGRLNTAIATSRIAAIADNYQLTEAAIKLMNDRSEAVALWGMKVAGSVLPAELRDPLRITEQTLLKQIIPSVHKHATGPIYEEAYIALSLNLQDPTRARSIKPEMVRAVVPVIQELFAERIDQLTLALVDIPGAENRASFFLTDPRVFEQQTAEQKVETVQLLSDHIALLAERATGVDENRKQRIIPVIAQTARALHVIAPENIKSVIAPATTLDNRSIPEKIKEGVLVIYPAFKKVTAYSGIVAPPAVSTAPATQDDADEVPAADAATADDDSSETPQ
jgi:hypothetical protein